MFSWIILLCLLIFPLLDAQEEHLAALPGISIWRQHIAALKQAEQQLELNGGGVNVPNVIVPEVTVHDVDNSLERKIKNGEELGKEELKAIVEEILRRQLLAFEERVQNPSQPKSEVELLLERNRDESSRSSSLTFLDELSNVYNQVQDNTGDEVFTIEEKEDRSNSFLDELSEIVEQENQFNDISVEDDYGFNIEDYFSPHDNFEIQDVSNQGTGDRGVLNLFSGDFEDDILNEVVDEKEFKKSFIEEEIASTEAETRELADQLAILLVDLEGDRRAESELIETARKTINAKLRTTKNIKLLAKDKDFIDSVLYRFAIRKLPLRQEDIGVAEEHEIRKVIRKSLGMLAEETQSLLLGERDRSGRVEGGRKRLIESRKQLQELINIMEA